MSKGNHMHVQLDEFIQPLGRFLGRDNAVHLLSEEDTWRPPVNIQETSNRYILEVELPGFSPDDVCVEVEEGVLRISCARTIGELNSNIIRRERPLGRFSRFFKLPPDTRGAHISAHMEAGVMFITVPRATTPKNTTIEIT